MDYDNDTVEGTIGSETQLELVEPDDISTESSSSEESSDDDETISSIPVPPTVTIPTTPVRNDVVVEETKDATPVSSNKKAKTKTTPTNVSIAHEDITDNNLVIFHTDLEIGGPHCGIIQIATVAFDVGTKTKLGTFDEFINPGNRYWDEQAIAVHNIQPSDPRIINASDIKTVWGRWKLFVEGFVDDGKKGAGNVCSDQKEIPNRFRLSICKAVKGCDEAHRTWLVQGSIPENQMPCW